MLPMSMQRPRFIFKQNDNKNRHILHLYLRIQLLHNKRNKKAKFLGCTKMFDAK